VSELPKMPYIKRLEFEKEKLTNALKLVLEHRKAQDFVNITGYKADAQKVANEIRGRMESAINEALNITGGNNE